MTTVESLPTEAQSLAAPSLGGRLLAKNATVLVGGQAVGLLVPLVTIPYLARVLGPAAWGPVIAAQALGSWLLIILEFGFELSATRDVARARSALHTMSDVVHGVQSAKAFLSVSALPLVLMGLVAVPSVRAHAGLVLWAVAYAIFRGFSPIWFFQGIERVQGAVTVDMLSRSLAALSVFALVHNPADGWKVVALQAAFAGLALALLTLWLSRHVQLRLPAVNAALTTLREGSTIFACRAWSGLYIQGNALILSALAGPMIVAFFGGAERIIRAAISLLAPLTQVFLPRVTYLQAVDPPAARRMVRRALFGVSAMGAAMGGCAIFGAPLLVHFILGSQYGAAIPVLRLMGVLPMLVAANSVIGLYWALPFGRERWLLASIVTAGLTNFATAILFVPRWGAPGMAASAILAEVAALIVMGSVYLRNER